MKFIAIESVRGLQIDQPVFNKDAEGNFGYGKLIKEEKTVKGIEGTFEMALFMEVITDWNNKTASEYLNKTPTEKELPKTIQTNITHVCIPK